MGSCHGDVIIKGEFFPTCMVQVQMYDCAKANEKSS
jgi:hypothetical protein